ncbi:MAG: hypothetical protein PHS74_12995 [Lachnospiraceae bacterium]|nr:hypothetical protein [Lachnospiraceae bacterium]
MKSAKNKNNEKINEQITEKNMTKEQILELKQKKKEMESELDELQGKTTKGKLICIGTFAATLALFVLIFVGMIKMNVGNFASDILAPVIADIPVVRSILPQELQKMTAAEIAADQQAAADEAASEEAIAEQAAADEAAEEEAIAEQAAADEAAEEEAIAEQAAADEAAEEEAIAEQEAADAAALDDYVKTYSDMKPKTAASVFDNMMTDQSELVVKILKNLAPDKRAAIIANMSVANASQVTVMMEQ